MTDYKLKLVFTEEQLRSLHLIGVDIVLAKSTADSDPTIAWQVFKPMQENIITWKEEYGIYVSDSEIRDGEELTQLLRLPVGADMKKNYTLSKDATMSESDSNDPSPQFDIVNKYQDKTQMTIGLYQNATVNGVELTNNAISAISVLSHDSALLPACNTVYIWLQRKLKSNSVAFVKTFPISEISFDESDNEISLAYDIKSGKFVEEGDTKYGNDILRYYDSLV